MKLTPTNINWNKLEYIAWLEHPSMAFLQRNRKGNKRLMVGDNQYGCRTGEIMAEVCQEAGDVDNGVP
jgi:hypothetical protein